MGGCASAPSPEKLKAQAENPDTYRHAAGLLQRRCVPLPRIVFDGDEWDELFLIDADFAIRQVKVVLSAIREVTFSRKENPDVEPEQQLSETTERKLNILSLKQIRCKYAQASVVSVTVERLDVNTSRICYAFNLMNHLSEVAVEACLRKKYYYRNWAAHSNSKGKAVQHPAEKSSGISERSVGPMGLISKRHGVVVSGNLVEGKSVVGSIWKVDKNGRRYREVPNKWQDGRVFDIIEKSEAVTV
eukprot:CAMPEP_0197716070 /NCGR_PEP_ID=MMETSP1434-20131217/1095_1 /TAXON_ID=265543 /ORGANISM="Minutocellus polymorphus, Strain CCMP3303" /LENGTH=244 /DNA_ID=CAMNT_0043300375 /DNA_START=33 /DNA_END=767 /DNA_ORIENTATION=+